MRLVKKILLNLSPVLAVAAISSFSTPAVADCTWYFNWYCSDCAKIGGQTTGTQSGYSSESSCNSARGSVASGVTTGSCSSSGYCDSPAATPSPGNGGGPGYYRQPQQRTYVPQIDYEAERRRQEAEQRRLDAEEAKRQARLKAEEDKRRRQFMKDKAEALGSLKGSVDFDGSGNGELKIKSSSGDSLGLKDGSSAVITGSDKLPVVHPYDIKGKPKPAKNVPVRDLPKKDVTRLGDKVASLVMDAIEEGDHDLDKSKEVLRGLLQKKPNNQEYRDAYNYIFGMWVGNMRAGLRPPQLGDDHYRRKSGRLPMGSGDDDLLCIVYPGNCEPSEKEKQQSEKLNNDSFLAYYDVYKVKNDFSVVRSELEKRAKAAPDDMALRGALRIAQGAEVYQDDINRRKTSGTLNK
ncbi:MAG: hypothetical protein EPN97_16880 [Alphaproteobacteria bacterium]|nr:MAG: hypothetical protein EPN97_16880 [Alphaproteobacteria bacterium]